MVFLCIFDSFGVGWALRARSGSGDVSKLAVEDLPGFLVLEVSAPDHGEDGVVDGPLVVEPLQHLELQLGVGNLGANGHSALYGFFDFANERHQFLWALACVAHTT